jgi:inosine-uridine nucleoside N-ribohydrolase
MLMRKQFNETIRPLIEAGSPLADWASAFLTSTFHKMETLYSVPEVGLQLHDPLTIWYLLVRNDPKTALKIEEDEDVRVETSGQWTRGMCVVDRRNRKSDKKAKVVQDEWEELPGDHGNWLNRGGGNRIAVAVQSPWVETFQRELIRRVFEV